MRVSHYPILFPNPRNNRGIWSSIEGATRHLANIKGEIYVVTGPIFAGSTLQRLNNRVLVPTHIFKAIYDPKSGQAAAYLVENSDARGYEIVSISKIKEISGIDPFPFLSQQPKYDILDLPVPLERR